MQVGGVNRHAIECGADQNVVGPQGLCARRRRSAVGQRESGNADDSTQEISSSHCSLSVRLRGSSAHHIDPGGCGNRFGARGEPKMLRRDLEHPAQPVEQGMSTNG